MTFYFFSHAKKIRFAFVRYGTEEEARNAKAALHAHPLDKKHIFCVTLYGEDSTTTDEGESQEFKNPVCYFISFS